DHALDLPIQLPQQLLDGNGCIQPTASKRLDQRTRYPPEPHDRLLAGSGLQLRSDVGKRLQVCSRILSPVPTEQPQLVTVAQLARLLTDVGIRAGEGSGLEPPIRADGGEIRRKQKQFRK